MTDPDSRRSRGRPPVSEGQRAELRLRVSLAAVRLFAEQGFASTTVDQVAAATQISTRTFWRLFASKEDCIRPMVTGGIDTVTRQLRSWPPGATLAEHYSEAVGQRSVEELLPPVMVALIRLVHTEPALHATWLTVHRESEATWALTIAERLAEPPGSLRVMLYAGMLNAALRAATESVIRTTDGTDGGIGARLDEAVLAALRELPF